jgi:hypothetical protein
VSFFIINWHRNWILIKYWNKGFFAKHHETLDKERLMDHSPVEKGRKEAGLIMKAVKLICIAALGFIVTFKTVVSFAGDTPESVNGKLRKDTFKMIEIEVRDTKSYLSRYNEITKKLNNDVSNAKSWPSAPSERFQEEYTTADRRSTEAIQVAGTLAKKSRSLARHIDSAGNLIGHEKNRKYMAGLKINQTRLKKSIEKAVALPGGENNKFYQAIRNDLAPKVDRKIEQAQNEIELLQGQARRLERQTNLSTVKKTVLQIGIYAEIQKHQLGVRRELLRIYAQVVAMNTGVKDEFKQALGDPAWLEGISGEMLQANWDTAFQIEDMLGLIGNLSMTGGLFDEATMSSVERANDILERGENPTGRTFK